MTKPPLTVRRALVVSKKTTYARYVEDERDAHFQALVRDAHPTARRLQAAHDEHMAAVEEARTMLASFGIETEYQTVGREALRDADLVITLGGDGTLLWVSHIVGPRTPMVAINTSPRDSVGYFCAGTRDSMEMVLRDAVAGALPATALTRMRVTLDGDVVSKRVLNDLLFSHRIPAATTRYVLTHRGVSEEHKSSGVWVGTAAGSTAAMRSAGGTVLPIDASELQFVVREPYIGDGAATRLTRGIFAAPDALTLENKTPTASIYLDGPYREHAVPMGSTLVFDASDEPLTILGLRHRKA